MRWIGGRHCSCHLSMLVACSNNKCAMLIVPNVFELHCVMYTVTVCCMGYGLLLDSRLINVRGQNYRYGKSVNINYDSV